MKLPMYIRHLIYKRRDNARRFMKADSELSAWLAANGVSIECRKSLKSIALDEESQRIIEAIKAAAEPEPAKAELTD